MDTTCTRRPINALATLTVASVVALTATTNVATYPPTTGAAAPPIVGQTVALAALPEPLQSLWDLARGADPAYPLPTPSNPIAPVAEQFVRNVVSYAGQLVAGQGAEIPGQIAVRINNVGAVLQGVPGYLLSNIEYIPVAVGGGAFVGFVVGGGLVLSAVGTLFPDVGLGPLGTLVVAGPAFAGAVVGAALGLVVLAPVYWTANTLKLRNSLAVALASTAPQPVSDPQPTVSTPGDTGVEQGPGSPTPQLTALAMHASETDTATTEPDAATELVEEGPNRTEAPSGVRTATPQLTDPAIPSVTEDPDNTDGDITSEAPEPAVGPEDPGTRPAKSAPRSRNWEKHFTKLAKSTAEKAESRASERKMAHQSAPSADTTSAAAESDSGTESHSAPRVASDSAD